MYIFNSFISSIFHQFHHSDTAGFCRHNVFRCQIYKRNEIYKTVYYIFHEKKKTSAKQTNKDNKTSYVDFHYFISIFHQFHPSHPAGYCADKVFWKVFYCIKLQSIVMHYNHFIFNTVTFSKHFFFQANAGGNIQYMVLMQRLLFPGNMHRLPALSPYLFSLRKNSFSIKSIHISPVPK